MVFSFCENITENLPPRVLGGRLYHLYKERAIPENLFLTCDISQDCFPITFASEDLKQIYLDQLTTDRDPRIKFQTIWPTFALGKLILALIASYKVKSQENTIEIYYPHIKGGEVNSFTLLKMTYAKAAEILEAALLSKQIEFATLFEIIQGYIEAACSDENSDCAIIDVMAQLRGE